MSKKLKLLKFAPKRNTAPSASSLITKIQRLERERPISARVVEQFVDRILEKLDAGYYEAV